jgi:hypothetical protein
MWMNKPPHIDINNLQFNENSRAFVIEGPSDDDRIGKILKFLKKLFCCGR